MAINKIPEGFLVARLAGADLSAKLHYLATIDSSENIQVAGDGAPVLGAIVEAGVEGMPVSVQFGGIAKVIVGAGGVTAGTQVASDGTGKLVAAADGDVVVGLAISTTAENGIASVVLGGGLGAS